MCRGVYIYITDSVYVDLGTHHFFVVGENTNFDFSTFLEIVNCNFAQTFTIDSTHQHGHIKISQMGNSCKLKNSDFPIFLKTVWTFPFHLRSLRRSGGALQNV